MNILITGANGLLGKKLVQLLSKEHKVFALVKDKNNSSFNKSINIIESDLSNFSIGILPKKIDVVYYLAQSNRFREFPEGVDDMFAINIHTPLKIIDWAKKNGVKKFIYASTGGVYTNPDRPVSEFFDINANNKQGFYPNSKLTAEILLKNYADFFETFVIIRPFFMYGKEQNHTMLIPRLINSVRSNTKITLSGEKGIKINPIYIDDATKSVAKILELKGEHIINIAGEEIISLKELAILIGKILKIDPVFKYIDTVQSDLIADISVMKSKLEKPIISIEEGLKNMCDCL